MDFDNDDDDGDSEDDVENENGSMMAQSKNDLMKIIPTNKNI